MTSTALLDAEPIEALTRRRLLEAAVAAAFLAACQADSGEEEEAEAADGTWPRTISHYMGDTEIPTRPGRVVAATDLFEVDNLLAMGVRPVLYGYSNRYDTGVTPWAEAAGEAGLERYDWAGEADLERIAAADPDIILSEWYWGGEQGYTQLAAIAPTIVLPKADTDETGWRYPQRVAGEACGTEQAAEDAIAATEQVLAEQRERLQPYADRVVTIAYGIYDGTWFADASSGPAGRILADLGIQLAAIGADDNAPISVEQINLLEDSDIIISYDSGPGAQDEWEANPLFRALPAVREGRYVVVSPEMLRAIFSPTTLSVRWAAPMLADVIIEAAEGRGKQLP